MAAESSLCICIGNATCPDAKALPRLERVSQAADISGLREAFVVSSIDLLEIVVLAVDLPNENMFNPMELASWVDFLSEGATVSIQVVGDALDLQPVHTAFVLAGMESASELKRSDGSRVLTAQRKSLSVTSALPLKKRSTAAVSLDSGDMIDEEMLLEDDILAPPPSMAEKKMADDCDGRKPCDNCTCGRAEQGNSGMEKSENAPSSSCGKCHLGDAWRCSSCPYLGKPAFKPGEEHLVLELADDF